MRSDVLYETLRSAGRGSLLHSSTGLLFILCSIYLSYSDSVALSFALSVSGGMLLGHGMGVDSVRADFAHKIMEMESENG